MTEQAVQIIRIDPKAIKGDPDFDVRDAIHDPGQITVIMQGMRNGVNPAPSIVWEDPDDGKFCVVDGRQRIAAFRRLNPDEPVPVRVLECSRLQATLEAVDRRSKGTLTLSSPERSDAAWRLVRAPALGNQKWAFSKADTAKAAGISERTMTNMRTRWRELSEAGREPSGNWQRDRRDYEGEREEMTDRAREAFMRDVTAAVDRALAPFRKKDDSALCVALEAAMGTKLAKHYSDYILNTDEPFDESWTDEGADDDETMTAF